MDTGTQENFLGARTPPPLERRPFSLSTNSIHPAIDTQRIGESLYPRTHVRMPHPRRAHSPTPRVHRYTWPALPSRPHADDAATNSPGRGHTSGSIASWKRTTRTHARSHTHTHDSSSLRSNAHWLQPWLYLANMHPLSHGLEEAVVLDADDVRQQRALHCRLPLLLGAVPLEASTAWGTPS